MVSYNFIGTPKGNAHWLWLLVLYIFLKKANLLSKIKWWRFRSKGVKEWNHSENDISCNDIKYALETWAIHHNWWEIDEKLHRITTHIVGIQKLVNFLEVDQYQWKNHTH
jgi:hypothetical protein